MSQSDLERLAARVATDPFFFACDLAAYQHREGLDDAGLASRLGCTQATLTDLRLCRRPGAADSKTVEEDVVRLAEAFNVPAEILATICAAAGNP